ncbi:unnamed protein product, partial [Mesorhabditis spiculigera]
MSRSGATSPKDYRYIGYVDLATAIRKTREHPGVFYLDDPSQRESEPLQMLRLMALFPSTEKPAQLTRVQTDKYPKLWYLNEHHNGPLFGCLEELVSFYRQHPDQLA